MYNFWLVSKDFTFICVEKEEGKKEKKLMRCIKKRCCQRVRSHQSEE